MDAPLGAAVGGDRRRWLGGGFEVVVAEGFVRLHERGQRVLGLKPKNEPLGLDYRSTIGNGCGGRWREMVGWRVLGGGAGGVIHSVAPGVVVSGLKPKNKPLWLGYGSAVGNGCGGRWREMVGWWVLGSGGGGVIRSVAQAGVVVLGQKHETEPLGLGYGCAIGNSCWGRWGEVVGWCV
jgi:hypothetical protein